MTSGPSKTSIRVEAGRYFTAIEGLTIAYPIGNPPYGLTYTSPEPPVMATPLTESKSLELRLETFNALNHAQFCGSSSVDGNIATRPLGRS